MDNAYTAISKKCMKMTSNLVFKRVAAIKYFYFIAVKNAALHILSDVV